MASLQMLCQKQLFVFDILNLNQFIWKKIANKKKPQRKDSDRKLFTPDALNFIF